MYMFRTGKSFRKEFKRQIRLAIIAAVGFTVAFAWRQTVFDAVQDLVKTLTIVTKPLPSEIVSSLTITILGVAVIIITSKILKD